VFRIHEPVKEKIAIDWQIEEQICDSFCSHIRELHEGDLVPQAPIEFNGPLHSNWVGLPGLVNQLITSKQPIQLTT